jgi:hypothetical protein
MEPEGSLPSSQEYATDLCPEPEEPNPLPSASLHASVDREREEGCSFAKLELRLGMGLIIV